MTEQMRVGVIGTSWFADLLQEPNRTGRWISVGG